MPQGDGYEKLTGVINAMGRLERVFAGVISSSKKLQENIDKSDELFGTSNRLKDDLQAAITSPVLFKKLNEVLSKNLGGTATPAIRQNLAKAAALRKQYMASNKAQKRLDVQVATLKAKRPHVSSAARLAALNQRIASLQNQSQNLGLNAFKQRQAMRAALMRSQKAALGSGSKLGTLSKIGMFSKAVGISGIALNVATEAVGFFTEKIRESSDIITKYSRYSVGGLHAASLMYIRDIHRNVQSSRALSGSMLEFAKASSDMKDSWKNINIVLDRLTLSFGTLGSKIGGGVGKFLEPAAKGFDKFMKGLADGNVVFQALAAVGGPLTQALAVLAKAVGWKTQEDELDELKARIARRRAAIVQGNMGGLQPGDMGPFEAGLLNLRPAPGAGFGRFPMPKKPGAIPNPNQWRPGVPFGGMAGGLPVAPNGVLGAGGAGQPPRNRAFVRGPIDDIIDKMALVEKNIKIVENDQRGIERGINQRRENIDKLERGGVTPDEQVIIDKKEAEINRLRDIQIKLQENMEEFRRQQRLLEQQRDGLKRVDARGFVNPWNAPGLMGNKPIGAHLMAV